MMVIVRRQLGSGRPLYLRSAGCWSVSVVSALEFESADAAERFMTDAGTSMNHCAFEPALRTFGSQDRIYGDDLETTPEHGGPLDAIFTSAYEHLREEGT